jgi:hypothetical protein
MHKAQHVADAAGRPDIAFGARDRVLQRSTATVEPEGSRINPTMPLASARDSIGPWCAQCTEEVTDSIWGTSRKGVPTCATAKLSCRVSI